MTAFETSSFIPESNRMNDDVSNAVVGYQSAEFFQNGLIGLERMDFLLVLGHEQRIEPLVGADVQEYAAFRNVSQEKHLGLFVGAVAQNMEVNRISGGAFINNSESRGFKCR